MTNDLAALSDAATQGEWTVCVYDCGDTPHYDANGHCPSIQNESEDCAIVHWDGFKQKYWTSANGNQCQIEANAALIVALVNEYRAGRLVQIDREEPARKFTLGQRVTKTKGSKWTGRIVGFYSTDLTPIGYAIESENEPGSVQIYPESAIAALDKHRIAGA